MKFTVNSVNMRFQKGAKHLNKEQEVENTTIVHWTNLRIVFVDFDRKFGHPVQRQLGSFPIKISTVIVIKPMGWSSTGQNYEGLLKARPQNRRRFRFPRIRFLILRFNYLRKINTGMFNSFNPAILVGALEFVHDWNTNGLATLTTFSFEFSAENLR